MKALRAAMTAALMLVAPSASANGRFPEANAIFLSEHFPDLVLLRVTFGLMISHDLGKTWGWVCERSLGVVGVEDPMYAITSSGRLIGSTFQGLVESTDMGCTNVFEEGPLAKRVFIDLAARPNDQNSVVAFASSYEGQDDAGAVRFDNRLWETTDEGRSFSMLGAPLDPYLLGQTVDYAATDPNRVYVSALRGVSAGKPTPVVLASQDHGRTWMESKIEVDERERAVYLAAVDPTNANRVYIRTQSAVSRPGRVLLSEDGARTWRTIFTSRGAVLGFALSSDGKKLWVGGPLDGVQMASTDDFVFAKKSEQPVQCLTVGESGLWSCASEKDGFVAGVSKDDGATWKPVLHYCDVNGVIDCPAGTPTHDECNPAWSQQRQVLGCAMGGDGTPEGGAPAVAPAETVETSVGGGGCTCRMGRSASLSGLAIGLATALLAAGRRLWHPERKR